MVALPEKSRVAAYEKFFGNVPDDTGNYNFNKWIEVIKYLGRTFEDVSGEERFDVDSTFMGLTTIKRAATASAPMVVLKDAPNQKKYVSWIGVLGPQNPSVEFMRRLRASLDSAWGKPKSTDGIDLWEWNGREFSAVLKIIFPLLVQT